MTIAIGIILMWLTVLELLTFILINHYVYFGIMSLHLFVPFYVFMVFLLIDYLSGFPERSKRPKIIIATTVSLLVILPLVFFLSLPTYTLAQAKQKMILAERIHSIDDQATTKITSTRGYDLYIITAERDSQKTRYIFNPYSGEYGLWPDSK
ncbi:hypothetical protein ACI7RC_20755 [Brevibacillus sp. B_LB10_24]|uniref:hypothetical protein n=1 Tax=Brevibacillus sp. B_LB10_24 TaxID=3380645 RepID=UPI0038BA56F2